MRIGDCDKCGRESTYIDETSSCPRCFKAEVNDDNLDEFGNEEIFIKCSCGSELLCFYHDKEMDTYDVYMYELPRKWGFKHKLKHIWQILRQGTPYSDYMVLDKKSAIKLANFIRRH